MKKYERRNQDIGNIVAFEHANVRVPDQQIATAFYVMGLGFTRDPYLMVGLDNMWINLGQQQFHLPTGAAQVFPGFIDMVVPDLDALTTRLSEVKDRLAGTKFTCSVEDKHVSVTCPWGNRMRLLRRDRSLATSRSARWPSSLPWPSATPPVSPASTKP